MTTYIGQNYGAGKLGRIEKGSKQGIIMTVIFSLILMVLMLLFAPALAGIFTTTETLKELAVSNLKLLAIGYVLMGYGQTMQGYLRGIGSTTATMVISIFTQVLARIPMAYWFAKLTANTEFPKGQAVALFAALVCSWVVMSTITTVFCIKKKKELRANTEMHWQTEYTE